jgi:hypothetical protein
MLSQHKMSEAEVTLRLAFCLISGRHVASDVTVAIDGAQIKTGNTVRFPIVEFLEQNGWTKLGDRRVWQGPYAHRERDARIIVHSSSGQRDLVAQLRSGRNLHVECKKGTLVRSKSAQEYRLLQEAIGQVVTIERIAENDILAVAVPCSDKFSNLVRRWRDAPLIRKCGIRLLTVDRRDSVEGLDLERA